jgi:hypothetical protein
LDALTEQVEYEYAYPEGSVMSRQTDVDPELRAAKAKAMVLELPRLLETSKALHRHLKDPEKDGPVWKFRYPSIKNVFSDVRELFADKSEPLINWGELAPDLPVQKGSQDYRKAVAILAAANIVSLQDDLIAIRKPDPDPDMVLAHLQRWDQDFPMPFLPPPVEIDSRWSVGNDTMPFALIVRTLRAVVSLRHFSTMNPRALIAECFCITSGSPDFNRLLERGPYRKLGGKDITHDPDVEKSYVTRINSLVSNFTKDGKTVNYRSLEDEYRYGALVDALVDWCCSLFTQVTAYIESDEQEDEQIDLGEVESVAGSATGTSVSVPIVRLSPTQEGYGTPHVA